MSYYHQQPEHRGHFLSHPGPNNPSRPVYPLAQSYRATSSSGGGVISFLFVLFAIAVVGGVVYLGLSYFGFDQITQIYGFDQVIEKLQIDPPPKM